MKKFIILGLFLMLTTATLTANAAKMSPLTQNAKLGISAYKQENYTECVQRLGYEIEKLNSNNVYAQYYYALGLWRVNQIDKAKIYINKVVDANMKGDMGIYASNAARCLNSYNECKAGRITFDPTESERLEQDSTKTNIIVQEKKGLDKFVASKEKTVSDSVKSDFEQKHLDVLRFEINAGHTLDDYTFQKYKDYSKKTINK